MDRKAFQSLTDEQVASLVREAGPKVCVFPINGTRRWFMLEHRLESEQDFVPSYLQLSAQQHVRLYKLFFDHGVDTLLTPVFGPDLLERGDEYLKVAAEGLKMLATDPAFLDFYAAYDVRVRFYGDYRKFFGPTPYAHLSDLFAGVSSKTAGHSSHRLFFGVCAHDATETVAQLAIRYHAEFGRPPDRRAIVEMYYGEYLDPVDFFIGFDKFSAFDMPLLATGSEDLYFTICPSLYLTARQLRDILYDHLFARRGGEPDYSVMTPEGWERMREFYRINRERTMGIGVKREPGGVWYPLPQVELPGSLAG